MYRALESSLTQGGLHDLGLTEVRLRHNNPAMCAALAAAGVSGVERVHVGKAANEDNAAYLRTKQTRMGHSYDADAPGAGWAARRDR